MKLIQTTEIWNGLTDLPLAVVSLICAILILSGHSAEKRLWFVEFMLITAAGLLGVIVHCFEMDEYVKTVYWIILYAIMYALVALFFALMYTALTGKKINKKWILASAVCYIGPVVLMITGSNADIYLFIAFAAVPASILTWTCKKSGKAAAREDTVLMLLVLAIIAQAMKGVIGNLGVVIAHLLVAAAEIMLFEVAKHEEISE